MQYIKPFMYFARKPAKGLTNLLMGVVCVLIPMIGGIILLGYRAEVADDLERDPELEDYPDFQFDRFIQYLQRGLWPFLTQLLMGLFIVFPLSILAFGVGFVIHEYVLNNMIVAFAGGMAIWGIGLIGMQAILWPMEYHAQVTKSFAPIQELRFAMKFLKKVGISTMMSILIFNMLGGALNMFGMALFCIGMYPAMVMQSMAEQHIIVQLYRLYLEEGGEAILQEQ